MYKNALYMHRKYIACCCNLVCEIKQVLPFPAIYDTSTPGGDLGEKKLAGLVLRIPARNKKGKEGAG